MKIIVSDLNEGEFFYNFVEETEKLNLKIPELTGNLNMVLKLLKSHDFILLKISVEGTMKLECDRCTELFIYHYKNSFELLYRYRGMRYEDISEKEDVNVYYMNKDEKDIDITEPLRDYLLLSIPMKKSPEEKNGICRFCNRRIDDILKINDTPSENPVWEKLKKLKT